MKATSILWDTDNTDDLPSEIQLPDGMRDLEEISDYLSNLTDYCHFGYTLEEDQPHDCYELYKMLWMRNHGYTLTDLVKSLLEYQKDLDEELSGPELMEEWEKNCGFGGSIWPCYLEFLETEYELH